MNNPVPKLLKISARFNIKHDHVFR